MKKDQNRVRIRIFSSLIPHPFRERPVTTRGKKFEDIPPPRVLFQLLLQFLGQFHFSLALFQSSFTFGAMIVLK